MTRGKPANIAASVQERLRQFARERNEDYQFVLTRYALERLLYRLSRSAHRDLFVLKGAILFGLWSEQPHRPTKDLDLLAHGSTRPERFEEIFRDVCAQEVEADGLEFQADTVRGEQLKEDQEYQGIRITFTCFLGKMRVPIQIDLGFGDAVTPAAVEVGYPTLLDLPTPSLRAYPKETVVAEKYQAMVMLGIANSRMKDYYDLWTLARQFRFEGEPLAAAIRATFERRRTALPGQPPLALTADFSEDKTKVQQWRAFLRKGRLVPEGGDLNQVVEVLREFIMPPTEAARLGEPYQMVWVPAGPWGPVSG